jgi:hypothetical protein
MTVDVAVVILRHGDEDAAQPHKIFCDEVNESARLPLLTTCERRVKHRTRRWAIRPNVPLPGFVVTSTVS